MESEKRILPIWKENGCIPVLDLRWDYRGWSDRSTRDARISTFADWLKNWEPIAMLVGDNLSLWIETGGSPTLEIVLCKGDARGLITIAGGRVLPKRAIEVLQRDPVALFQVLFGEVAGLSLLLHIGMWGFSGFRYDGAPVEDLQIYRGGWSIVSVLLLFITSSNKDTDMNSYIKDPMMDPNFSLASYFEAEDNIYDDYKEY